MIPRTKLTPVLLLVILFLFQMNPLTIEAQDEAQDIVPANGFLICNKSKKTVFFSLRKGSEAWVQIIFDPDQKDIFKGKDQIYISPPGQEPIHRSLRLGKRYKIVHDGSTWNIELMEL